MLHSKWIVRDCSLNERALLKNEAVFTTANGYIGVRGCFEEGSADYKTIRGAYINGCSDTEDICYDEKLSGFPETKQTIVNIQDFQTVEIWVGSELFSLFRGTVLSFDRFLDMKNGICRRYIEWETKTGKRLKIEIARMASLAVRELFTIDCRVTPLNFSGEFRFVSKCSADVANYSDSEDPRTNSRTDKSLRLMENDITDGFVYLETETVHSGISVGTGIRHTVSVQAEWEYALCGDAAVATATVQASQEEEIRFVKYVHCVSSLHTGNLKQAAMEMSGRDAGQMDALYVRQRDYLDARWEIANVQIDADDGADVSLRYCIYQLICHGQLTGGSIPAKGLSGEGYAGHYFWDTEIFIHPFYALNDPHTARELLLFRHRQLDAARQNARSLGHPRGAAYPWRTITGSECSSFFPGGAAQYHINADIAYALVSYFYITGDEALLLNEGAEILFETARLWMEIGHFHEGCFRIDTVTGPDEYTCLINNNYYTNLLARHNLEWAVRVYERLTGQGQSAAIERTGLNHEETEGFRRAYENMYFPPGDEVTPQDDSFLAKKQWDFAATPKEQYPLLLHYHPMTLYRYQVCKQADVLLAYYLFQKETPKALMERSYAFYENITTHDSSLSACIFSIMAARLGMTEKAYAYFDRTIRLDIDDIHGNTKDGLHMANLGGSYLCVLGGFAGLVIDGEGVSLAPVLPAKWRAYRFRFLYRGSLFEAAVSADRTEIKRVSGLPQRILLDGIAKEY